MLRFEMSSRARPRLKFFLLLSHRGISIFRSRAAREIDELKTYERKTGYEF